MARWNQTIRWTLGILLGIGSSAFAAESGYRSHPPMRPLPVPANRPMDPGPAYFVDAVKGNDQQDGSREKPWKTISHALQHLKPGDTLYLRGGTYYEAVTAALSGTAEKPIAIRSYPGELAILDGGFREFAEDPANAWEPYPQGAPGEFRSTKTYRFGGGFGNFGDSMVPFHRYLTFSDLRSNNELARQELGGRADDPIGIYAGPGIRRDPETGRIHIRLAHTKLDGLGVNHYRGETDPRKLPLVIAGAEYALRIDKAKHLRVRDLVVRGAARAAVTILDAEDVELSGLTLYGSGAALVVHRTQGLKLLGSALHGHAAPWHSRYHHKYRAHAGYLVLAQGNDFEFAFCEFTDHHDAIQIYGVDGMRFHHNYVDNFNDDGIEVGPQKERGIILIYQNLITRCLSTFTLHGKKPHPVPTEPGSGVYIYRNIVDLRQGTYKSPPYKLDPSGAFLNHASEMVAHDHGSPTWPNYYVYQNTFILPGNTFHSTYAFHWGASTQGTRRRVFNNIFIQVEGLPGLRYFSKADEDFQADGNLLWGMKEGPKQVGDFFAKFRDSPLFAASKKQYPPGWGAQDRFANPKFVSFQGEGKEPPDFRLQKDSPAIDAGVVLPAEWPDPLRQGDQGKPDVGALPLGAEPFRVGPGAARPPAPAPEPSKR